MSDERPVCGSLRYQCSQLPCCQVAVDYWSLRDSGEPGSYHLPCRLLFLALGRPAFQGTPFHSNHRKDQKPGQKLSPLAIHKSDVAEHHAVKKAEPKKEEHQRLD